MKYFLLAIGTKKERHFVKTSGSSFEVATEKFCEFFKSPKNAIKEAYELPSCWFNYQSQTILKKHLYLSKIL